MRAVLALAAGAAVLGAGAAAGLVLGLRRAHPGVVRAVTTLQRDVLNRRAVEAAATGGPYDVVVHRGRRSGREYRTPVGASPVGDGLVVLLPYGSRADWVRNVLAGGAQLLRGGVRYPVVDPRVASVEEVRDRLARGERAVVRVFGISEVLLLGLGPPSGP